MSDMSLQLTMYGIPNCDTVKKARTWLQDQGISFVFHDYKKQGLSAAQIQQWLQHLPLEQLINRKGTSYRALDEDQKTAATTADSAIPLLLEKPSLIKRPLLIFSSGSAITHAELGFSADSYQALRDLLAQVQPAESV